MDPISLGLIAELGTAAAGAGAGAGAIGGAGMAAGVGGGILNAVGSLFSGKAKSQQMQYQAGIAGINKQINLQNADYERRTGEVQAQQSGMKSRFQIGNIKATQGASGFDVNTGSPAGVVDSQHDIAVHDQTTIRANAARRAYGYEVAATSDEASARLLKMGAKSASSAGKIGFASSILGTAASVSSKWLQGNQQGLWGGKSDWVGDSGHSGWIDNPDA